MADHLKVTIADLLNSAQALVWLGEQKLPLDRVLPFIGSRRVAQTRIKDFYEARDSIIKRYAGGGKQVPAELVAQANEEISALLPNVVEVPDPGLTWEATKGLFTTANLLEPLLWIIKGMPLE